MKMRFPTRSGVVLTIAAMLAPVALAQPVLRGGEITEDRLIDALTPGPDEVRTRSIRVEREAPTAKKGAASLLITFETNSARLSSAAERSLDVVARALQADRLAAFNFSVEGHADPRGGADYNLRLSQARAESVVDYLAGRHGIPRDRLRPIGKGQTELANPGRPTAPENRRVTIKTLQ